MVYDHMYLEHFHEVRLKQFFTLHAWIHIAIRKSNVFEILICYAI